MPGKNPGEKVNTMPNNVTFSSEFQHTSEGLSFRMVRSGKLYERYKVSIEVTDVKMFSSGRVIFDTETFNHAPVEGWEQNEYHYRNDRDVVEKFDEDDLKFYVNLYYKALAENITPKEVAMALGIHEEE